MACSIMSSNHKRIWPALAAVVVGAWLMAPLTAAYAAQPVTAEATVTFAGPKTYTLPAGDDQAHVVGLGQRKGKAVFKDGRTATYSNVFFMDLYRGKGVTLWGYTKMTFKDGSWFYFKRDSKFAGRDQAGAPMFQGTGTILKGSGKYQGITGTLKYRNKRVGPSKDFPKGATQAQVVMTYTLP